MIRIDTSPIRYWSYLDEDAFFEWAQKIPRVTSIDGGFLHIKSKRISKPDLYDLIAIMYRYDLPMKQLQQFCNPQNECWFKSKQMYWYSSVFGRKARG